MNDIKKIREEADRGLVLCEDGDYQNGIRHLLYAAERNDIEAIVNVGHAYEEYGLYDEAFKWTSLGAELNHPTAISNLALLYRNGKGVKCNVNEAIKLWQRLIDMGYIDEGFDGIVTTYQFAEDESQRDYEKSFEYALAGAQLIMKDKPELGKTCDVVEQLAICYECGKGVEINVKEALRCHLYCAACGLGIGCYNAACIYGYSEDPEINNINKCINCFIDAIKMGCNDAYYELACLFQNGDKVRKDLSLAAICYSCAIRYGSWHCLDAIQNLKKLLEEDSDLLIYEKYSNITDEELFNHRFSD